MLTNRVWAEPTRGSEFASADSRKTACGLRVEVRVMVRVMLRVRVRVMIRIRVRVMIRIRVSS